MKAYHVKLTSSKQGVLTLNDVAMPECAVDELLIKVQACGLNRADIFQRQGSYPSPKGASKIPGLEVSGIVEAVGELVSDFKQGQRVCALLEGGGYAEYVTVKASQVLPTPNNLSNIEASALPEALFTVWYNCFEKAKLQPHETILVHGGSSGIGVTAIAICRLLGIHCLVTTTHPEKASKLRLLGASEVICTTQNDLVGQVKALTDGKGVDVILDMVGGDYVNQNLKMLRYGGRLAIIALLQGAKAQVNFGALLLKNLTITGTTLRHQPAEVKAKIANDLQKTIWPLITSQAYKPEIDRVFDFKEAMAAQQYMEENRHIGKIVLQLQ